MGGAERFIAGAGGGTRPPSLHVCPAGRAGLVLESPATVVEIAPQEEAEKAAEHIDAEGQFPADLRACDRSRRMRLIAVADCSAGAIELLVDNRTYV